jgi:hypothetical protein
MTDPNDYFFTPSAEMVKEILKRQANPLVKWDAKSKTIDIVSGDHQYTWERPYYIDLDRIKTYALLLGWLTHLLRKKWFTTRHAQELIRVWADVTGKEVNVHG